MKDYFYFHKSWFRKCKGFPTIFRQILDSNSKRQMMTKEEGLLFIRLMKKTYNSKRRIPSCLNAG